MEAQVEKTYKGALVVEAIYCVDPVAGVQVAEGCHAGCHIGYGGWPLQVDIIVENL